MNMPLKSPSKLIITLLVLVAGTTGLGLTVQGAISFSDLPRQLCACVLGGGILLAMIAVDEELLSKYGYIATIGVLLLCWIGPSFFHPGHWLPPACVLGLASVRRYEEDTWTVGIIAMASVVTTMSPQHLAAGSISCLTIGLLYGYVVKPQTHRKLKWALAIALGLVPFVFRTLAILHTPESGFMLDTLSWPLARCDRSMLASAFWFGPLIDLQTNAPFNPPWMGMLGKTALHCGKGVLLVLLTLWTSLAACLVAATYRCRTPTRRILILGGSFILIVNMSASVIKLFFNLTFVKYLHPFLTPGGSAAVGSFLALGLVIVGLSHRPVVMLRDERRLRILAASLAVLGLAGLLFLPHPTTDKSVPKSPAAPTVHPASDEDEHHPSPYKEHRARQFSQLAQVKHIRFSRDSAYSKKRFLPKRPLVQALFLDGEVDWRDLLATHRPVAQGLPLRAHLAACDLLHLAQAPARPLQAVESVFCL